jgi:hypothetical protein
MLTKHTLLGMVLLTYSTGGLILTIWRFQWLQRYAPFLLYWGRWPWHFPATRIGVAAGFLVGMTIGSFCFDSNFQVLSRQAWVVILIANFALVLIAAIHDYILHKRGST